jgi:hypothetical protein
VRKALRRKAGVLDQVARKFDDADYPAFISDAFAARYNRRSARVEDRLNAATRALVGALERGIPAPAGPDLGGIVPS